MTYTEHNAPYLADLSARLDEWGDLQLALHAAAKALRDAMGELDDAERLARQDAHNCIGDINVSLDTAAVANAEWRELEALAGDLWRLRRRLDAFAHNAYPIAFRLPPSRTTGK